MPICPICRKSLPENDVNMDYLHPFCSRRCADVDLHRWLGGVYVISDNDANDVEAEELNPVSLV